MRSLFAWFPVLLLAACQSAEPAPEPAEPVEVAQAADAAWKFQGTWTDACCCKVSCPCLFGTGPTEGFCEGASWFEVDAGHYDGVPLDGLSAVVTYRVKNWTRIVVEDDATDEQVRAFGALVPELLAFVNKGGPPAVTSGALTLERGEGTVRYGTDETEVRIGLLESATGEPIRLQGLPAKGTPFPVSHEHTQYVSKRLAHRSSDGEFEWSGRNGFSSTIDLTHP